MDPTPAPLIPQDGWHCLHLYYRIEFGQWQLLNAAEQRAAKIALSTLVQETRALESTQLLTMSAGDPESGSRVHVHHARSARREPDRKATYSRR